MEPYEKILESAQRAIDRRDRAQHELEYMLDDADTSPPARTQHTDARRNHRRDHGRDDIDDAEPETWPRLAV